jgi:hypothetical protein
MIKVESKKWSENFGECETIGIEAKYILVRNFNE